MLLYVKKCNLNPKNSVSIEVGTQLHTARLGQSSKQR